MHNFASFFVLDLLIAGVGFMAGMYYTLNQIKHRHIRKTKRFVEQMARSATDGETKASLAEIQKVLKRLEQGEKPEKIIKDMPDEMRERFEKWQNERKKK